MSGNQPNKHIELAPTDDSVEVGNLIRKWRENINMTQLELSEKAGLGEKTISRLEMGKSNMRIDTYFTLADALGITPNDIAPSRFVSLKKGSRFPGLISRVHLLDEEKRRLVFDLLLLLINGLQNIS